MKLNYERPSMSVIDCEVELPVAYSVQPGDEGEDDVILGVRPRDVWKDGADGSLWVTDDENPTEDAGYSW